ncbi:MAG: hypothetical protein Q9161_007957 [Pseudevernia consocians]
MELEEEDAVIADYEGDTATLTGNTSDPGYDTDQSEGALSGGSGGSKDGVSPSESHDEKSSEEYKDSDEEEEDHDGKKNHSD